MRARTTTSPSRDARPRSGARSSMRTASPASAASADLDQRAARQWRCCWRRPTNAGHGSSSRASRAAQREPARPLGRATRRHRAGRGPRPTAGASDGAVEVVARRSSGHRRAGTGRARSGMSSASSPGTGQPSTQSTGTRNVSRPSTWNTGVMPRGRVPSSTIHHDPSVASTRSAWPVFWIGRSVLRWLRIGLAGQLSHGPVGRRAAGDRDAVPALGAALGDQQVPPVAAPEEVRRLRILQAGPRPRELGPSSTSPVRSSIRHRSMPPPREVDPAVARRRPRRGRGRCRARRRAPVPTTGPPGPRRSRRSSRHRVRREVTVVIIQKRPSWCRSVGANTPTRRERLASRAGRAATAGRARCRSGSSRRDRASGRSGRPGST